MFELIWIRRLSFAFGCSIEATAAAVAAFMLGLGLGAYLSGRWLTRVPVHPIVLFGALELFIAASGLSILWLMGSYEGLVAWLASTSLGQPPFFGLCKILIVALTLLLPCSAMGATLPLLTHYCHHTLRGEFAGWLGRLYAINTTGAICGVYLTDFVLVERWGMWRTGLLAAGLDLCVGSLALLLSRQALAPAEPEPDDQSSEDRTRFLAIPFLALFGSGMCGMLLQIFWTRLTVFLNGIELGAYSITLCTYLLGHLLGAGLAGRISLQGRQRLRQATALFFCAVAVCTASTVVLVGRLPRPNLSGDGRQMFLNDMAIMLPATICLGILFVLASQLVKVEYHSAGRSVGAAYLWNTLGSVLGSLTAGFVLVPLFGLQNSFYATLAITWMLGLVLLASGGKGLPALVLGGLSCLTLPMASHWSLIQALTKIPPQSVLYQGEDSYGSVTVAEQVDLALKETNPTLLVDGFMMAGLNLAAKHFTSSSAALGVLLHPKPDRVLVVCLGIGNTLRAATELTDCPIECVELSPQVAQGAKMLPPTREALDSGRVTLTIGDGRHHLLTTREHYDVIMTEPPPAQNAGAVNLYSREYFGLCRSRLQPQGVVVQWIPASNLDTSELKSIFRAFQEVFPDCYLFHVGGYQFCLVGSDHPIRLDFSQLQARVESHRPFLQSVGLAEPELLPGCLLAGPQALREATANIPPLTDDWPALRHTRHGAHLDLPFLLFSGRLPWQEMAMALKPDQQRDVERAYLALRDLNRVNHGASLDPPLCLLESYYLAWRAVQAYPDNPYFALITLTNPSNRAWFERAADQDPGARFECARIAYIQGRLKEARSLLELGLAQAPPVQAPVYQACMGLVALAQGHPGRALQLWDQALRAGGLNPSEVDFLNRLKKAGPSAGTIP